MPDKTILVTGSTDGIGKETARQLAQFGATVIVHGRSAERCQAARDDIRPTTGNPNVDFVVADLSSQRQVRQMAAEIIARYDRLHVLINNAGVILLQRQLTEDGVETDLRRQSSRAVFADQLAAGCAEGERARRASSTSVRRCTTTRRSNSTICRANGSTTASTPTR